MAEDRRGGRAGQGGARGGKGAPGGRGGSARSDRGGRDERAGGAPRGGGGRASGAGRGAGSGGASGKPYGGKSGGSKAGGAGATGKPYAGKGAGQRSGSGPRRSDERPRGGRDQRFERQPAERTSDQRAYDGPDLPEHITGKELDRSIAAQLKGLPEKLAARIARHLVAAGTFIDSDPELAYQHAKAAKSRAQRLAVVREALGEAAYAAGHYAEALAELRAAKRMNGATAYLPIMADCHRALGQPEQAIKLAHSPSVAGFIPEAKAEMTIVEAGARRDLGQFDAALRVLELAPLHSKSRASWVVRLRYAYADTLEQAGRLTDALAWFHRTHAIDADQITDAEERAASLEGRLAEG